MISELGRYRPPGERCADERVHVGLGSRIVARHIPLNKEWSSSLKTAWGYFFGVQLKPQKFRQRRILGSQMLDDFIVQ